MGKNYIPLVIIFTKADRIGKPKLEENIAAFMGKLSENWETLPTYFVSSAERRTGREEILEFIGKAVKLSNSPTSKKN